MKVTKTYEWARLEEGSVVIGITKKAQKEIGEIVHIHFPKVKSCFKSGEEVLVLESTKSAIDAYIPISGEVVEVNSALLEDYSLLNSDPEGAGWLYKIIPQDVEEYHALQDYTSLVKESS